MTTTKIFDNASGIVGGSTIVYAGDYIRYPQVIVQVALVGTVGAALVLQGRSQEGAGWATLIPSITANGIYFYPQAMPQMRLFATSGTFSSLNAWLIGA